MDAEGAYDYRPDAEFETWHVYDAGGPVLSLKVRYRDDAELQDWQDGPDLFAALRQSASEGWHAYDREPGDAPGEYAIFHLKRDARGDRRSR
jgi:hypothetical protein